MKNMIIWKMDASSQLVTKSEFSCQEFKPYGLKYQFKKVMQAQTQKHGFRSKLFNQNETLFKNTWKTIFSFQTNFKTMHDMQNKSDRAMKLDDQQAHPKEIKILTSKLGSNGSSHQDQAWKTTLTQELFSLPF